MKISPTSYFILLPKIGEKHYKNVKRYPKNIFIMTLYTFKAKCRKALCDNQRDRRLVLDNKG